MEEIGLVTPTPDIDDATKTSAWLLQLALAGCNINTALMAWG